MVGRNALQQSAKQLRVSSVTIEAAACFHEAVVLDLTALMVGPQTSPCFVCSRTYMGETREGGMEMLEIGM